MAALLLCCCERRAPATRALGAVPTCLVGPLCTPRNKCPCISRRVCPEGGSDKSCAMHTQECRINTISAAAVASAGWGGKNCEESYEQAGAGEERLCLCRQGSALNGGVQGPHAGPRCSAFTALPTQLAPSIHAQGINCLYLSSVFFSSNRGSAAVPMTFASHARPSSLAQFCFNQCNDRGTCIGGYCRCHKGGRGSTWVGC